MSAASERWKFIGGRLCLDYINTVGAWVSRPDHPSSSKDHRDLVLRDRLKGIDELLQWSREADDLSAGEAKGLARLAEQKPGEAAATFTRAMEARETLYRLFKSVVEGWDPAPGDLDSLQRGLAAAREHRDLLKAEGRFEWRWKTDPPSLDRPLWAVLDSAESLLTAPNLGRLRQCAGEECGWFFLDESRGGRRQWCEMSDCGNLAKVRRHRERIRQARP